MSNPENNTFPEVDTRLDGSRLQYIRNQFDTITLPEPSRKILVAVFCDWFDQQLTNENGLDVLSDPLGKGEEKSIQLVVDRFMKLFDHHFYMGNGISEEERQMVDSFFGYLHMGDPSFIYRKVEMDERYRGIPESDEKERSDMFKRLFYEALEPYLLSTNKPVNVLRREDLPPELGHIEQGEGLNALLKEQGTPIMVQKIKDFVSGVLKSVQNYREKKSLETQRNTPKDPWNDVEMPRDFKKLKL